MHLTIAESLLYGFVQGTTEYLPVSSSAHLLLLPRFLRTEDPGLAFDVFLHIGTLFATTIYFWKDWWTLLNPRTITKEIVTFRGVSLGNIILATLPAVVIGLLLKKQIETVFRGEMIVAAALAIGGVLLWAFDRFSPVTTKIDEFPTRSALGVGFFQCLSLVPGMSRSGSTMLGSRALGLNRESAARFSFLMSVPVTFGAILMEMRHWGEALQASDSMVPMVVGGVTSFAFGILTIHYLLKLVRRVSFAGFAIYRVALGLVVYLMFHG